MKFKKTPYLEPLRAQTNIILPFDPSDSDEALELLYSWNIDNIKADYSIEIKKKKHKRTLDQNGYMWQLLGQMAKMLKTTSGELYRDYVRKYGTYTVVPIKENAVYEWIRIWRKNGIGWLADDLGPSKIPHYHNIKCYNGTSSYDVATMRDLLEQVIDDCKHMDIPTLPEEELEAMRQNEINNQR